MQGSITALGVACIALALLSLAIIARHLVKKPALTFATKLWLSLGLGLLPGAAAVTNTVASLQTTTTRTFCGSCHVMVPYVGDASDPESQSLAARHGRNPYFGGSNCYVCHADYGMYGYPLTKLNGMRHVYEYYIGGWRSKTLDEALSEIHLRKRYDNTNCRQCHTGTLADWSAVPEHVSLAAELDNNDVSCASAGCHGYAHPFTKSDGAQAGAMPPSAIGPHGSARPVGPGVPATAAARIVEAREDERARVEAAAASASKARQDARDAARKAAAERTAPTAEENPR